MPQSIQKSITFKLAFSHTASSSAQTFIGGKGFGFEGVIAYFDDSIRHRRLLCRFDWRNYKVCVGRRDRRQQATKHFHQFWQLICSPQTKMKGAQHSYAKKDCEGLLVAVCAGGSASMSLVIDFPLCSRKADPSARCSNGVEPNCDGGNGNQLNNPGS